MGSQVTHGKLFQSNKLETNRNLIVDPRIEMTNNNGSGRNGSRRNVIRNRFLTNSMHAQQKGVGFLDCNLIYLKMKAIVCPSIKTKFMTMIR